MIAALIALLSYLKANKIQLLSLRTELRKAIIDFDGNYKNLLGLKKEADLSRIAVLAARGLSGSSAMGRWLKRSDTDKITLENLKNKLPDKNSKHEGLNSNKLENKTIEIYELNKEIEPMHNFYTEALEKDAEDRLQLKEDHRILMQSKMTRTHHLQNNINFNEKQLQDDCKKFFLIIVMLLLTILPSFADSTQKNERWYQAIGQSLHYGRLTNKKPRD